VTTPAAEKGGKGGKGAEKEVKAGGLKRRSRIFRG
jgi:hypothetical protein